LEQEALVGRELSREEDLEQPNSIQDINYVEFFIVSVLCIFNQSVNTNFFRVAQQRADFATDLAVEEHLAPANQLFETGACTPDIANYVQGVAYFDFAFFLDIIHHSLIIFLFFAVDELRRFILLRSVDICLRDKVHHEVVGGEAHGRFVF